MSLNLEIDTSASVANGASQARRSCGNAQMSTGLACLGEFTVLASALDARQCLSRWASRTPALAQLGSLTNLLIWRDTHDAAANDAMLAALVWWASTDGGDDQDAVLLLLHLLAPGVGKLTGKMRSLCGADAQAVVIGELTLQIRQFPCQRRTRAIAANLLLDTQAALLREWLPYRRVGGQQLVWEVPFDPSQMPSSASETDPAYQPSLQEMTHWARRNGLLDEREAQTLIGLVAESIKAQYLLSKQGWQNLAGEKPNKATGSLWAVAEQGLAKQIGVSVRTIQRRKARALEVLRQSRWQFLAQAA